MFDLDQFIAYCTTALAEAAPQSAIRETMARAVADPAAVLNGLGEPKRAGIQKLFHSASLTVLNVVWAPRMTLLPHDHRMWAVIGIYTGREDNIFWRRVKRRAQDRGGGRQGALREGRRASRTRRHSRLTEKSARSPSSRFSRPRLAGALHLPAAAA
ncbi:MAG: hypothetical protein ACXW25_04290 [Rhodospirillales bacterium]